VVVPQPTCSYVLKKEYPHLVPGEATDRVAARTHDPFEFLALRQREGAQATDFSGRGPGRVAYHVPCHLRAQNIGYKTRDVLQLIPGTTVGDTLTFLFENRETVLLQIQEMIRTERIVDEDKTGEELATSNALVPDAGELSATLFIEIANIARMSTEQMRAAVNRFQGLEAAVRLEGGGGRIPGRFEGGHAREEKMAGLQFVRFSVPAAARRALGEPAQPARLVVDHPNYKATAHLPPPVRADRPRPGLTDRAARPGRGHNRSPWHPGRRTWSRASRGDPRAG
jgi:hypothetical protein